MREEKGVEGKGKERSEEEGKERKGEGWTGKDIAKIPVGPHAAQTADLIMRNGSGR